MYQNLLKCKCDNQNQISSNDENNANNENEDDIFDEDDDIPESPAIHSDVADMLQVGEIDKTLTKYYVDQREVTVLSYTVIGLCPELITVNFFIKKNLISGYSVNNTLKERLKKLSNISISTTWKKRIFFSFFCSGLTEILVLFLPEIFDKLSCPFLVGYIENIYVFE